MVDTNVFYLLKSEIMLLSHSSIKASQGGLAYPRGFSGDMT